MSNLGQLAYQGWAGLSRSLDERAKEDKERARKFKAAVEYADAAGIMPRARAITMDADALAGMLEGSIAKRKLDEVIEQRQMQRERDNVNAAAAHMNMLRDAATVNRENAALIGDQQFGAAMSAAQTPRFEFDGSGQMQTPALDAAAILRIASKFPQSPTAKSVMLRALQERDQFKPMLGTLAGPDGRNYTYATTSRGGAQILDNQREFANEIPEGWKIDQEMLNKGLVISRDPKNPNGKQKFHGRVNANGSFLSFDGEAPPAGGTPPNVTQEQYAKLKKGDTYWWNGQQLTKQ